MRIISAQISQVWEDIDRAFESAEAVLKDTDADIVIFPEQFATGWNTTPSGFSAFEIKARWKSLAKKYSVHVVGSYQKPTATKPENTMLVCAPNGAILAEYSKIHLFSPGGEDACFTAGRAPSTFEISGIKFGCAICFDLRFPELFREYMREGCHAILFQAAWAAARTADLELLIRARALENRMYIVGSCALGYGNGMDFSGRSLVCNPEGRIIADAGVFEGDAVWEFEVDDVCHEVKDMRKQWGVL